MKKWLAYMLSLYILFNAVVPCSIFDKCEEGSYTGQTSNPNHKKDCSGCSPFSVCSCTHGFTINTVNTIIAPVEFCSSLTFSEYYFSSKSEYYSRFFQPPRLSYDWQRIN